MQALSARQFGPRAGSRVERIDFYDIVAGCHKRRLKQALSLSSLLDFEYVYCAVN